MERKGFPESYDLPALLAFLSDIKAGQAQRRRAGLFAPRLRHRAGRDDHHRPAGHPHRRGAERAADLAPAARRPRRAVRLRLLRFLDLSRRRRGRSSAAGMSSGSCASARPPSAIPPPISTATPRSPTRRRGRPPTACGSASISSTFAKTSCRPGRAPISSSRKGAEPRDRRGGAPPNLTAPASPRLIFRRRDLISGPNPKITICELIDARRHTDEPAARLVRAIPAARRLPRRPPPPSARPRSRRKSASLKDRLLAHAGRDGESPPAHRARDRRCAPICGRLLRPRHADGRRQSHAAPSPRCRPKRAPATRRWRR